MDAAVPLAFVDSSPRYRFAEGCMENMPSVNRLKPPMVMGSMGIKVMSKPVTAKPMLQAMVSREPMRPAMVPAIGEPTPVSQRR